MTEIERKRLEKGYTQRFMAEKIKVSIGCYNMYENNQRKIPKDKAEEIARVLECDVNEIFIPNTFTNCETSKKEVR